MGEADPSASQCRSVRIECLVVEVVFHLLIEEVGLADENAGSLRSMETLFTLVTIGSIA